MKGRPCCIFNIPTNALTPPWAKGCGAEQKIRTSAGDGEEEKGSE